VDDPELAHSDSNWLTLAVGLDWIETGQHLGQIWRVELPICLNQNEKPNDFNADEGLTSLAKIRPFSRRLWNSPRIFPAKLPWRIGDFPGGDLPGSSSPDSIRCDRF
jgi:hypothetical protein